jgi:hypothetical protein
MNAASINKTRRVSMLRVLLACLFLSTAVGSAPARAEVAEIAAVFSTENATRPEPRRNVRKSARPSFAVAALPSIAAPNRNHAPAQRGLYLRHCALLL